MISIYDEYGDPETIVCFVSNRHKCKTHVYPVTKNKSSDTTCLRMQVACPEYLAYLVCTPVPGCLYLKPCSMLSCVRCSCTKKHAKDYVV